jgi:DNA-binding GntR family transcriptional regulator
MNRLADPQLVELVDALVAAIDSDRTEEVNRVRSALEPFGATRLFDAELRLNGTPTTEHVCCFGECVEAAAA